MDEGRRGTLFHLTKVNSQSQWVSVSNCIILETITVICDFHVTVLFKNDKIFDCYWDGVLRGRGTHLTQQGVFFSFHEYFY